MALNGQLTRQQCRAVNLPHLQGLHGQQHGFAAGVRRLVLHRLVLHRLLVHRLLVHRHSPLYLGNSVAKELSSSRPVGLSSFVN